MKHIISIILIALFITILVMACSINQDIQVENQYARLIRKETHLYNDGWIYRQYWQDTKRNAVYWEELPLGDTGVSIGTMRQVLVTR